MLAPCVVALYLMLEAPHLTLAGHHMSGLGAALLDSHLMPPSLLVESRAGTSTKKSKPVNNATVGFALSTMGFHRQKMNEYLCRGYMAEDILERLQEDAEDVNVNEVSGVKGKKPSQASARRGEAGDAIQPRKGNSKRQSGRGHQGNHRSNQLLTDEGSSNYKDWLTRSAVLEDIYRRYEHVDEEPSAEDRQDESKDDDYDGEVTGWAMEEPYWPKQDTGRHPEHDDIGDHYHHHHSDYGGEPIIASSNSNSALSLGVRDVFDVALTAIAFLAFGIFILNVFLGILLPSSSTRTVVISNLTLPFRNRDGALDLSHEKKKHERITRWIEDEPLERVETTEESAARLALSSIRAALGSTPAHCLQAALCKGNKESRSLDGHAKYWMPVWSLGMSWLARRAGGAPGSEAGSASLFSGALENLRAATLGLAGARCSELFPSC